MVLYNSVFFSSFFNADIYLLSLFFLIAFQKINKNSGSRALFCDPDNLEYTVKVAYESTSISRPDITLHIIGLPDGIETDENLFQGLNRGDFAFALLRDGDVFHRWRQFADDCVKGSSVAWRTSTNRCVILHHALDSPVMRERWAARLKVLDANMAARRPGGELHTRQVEAMAAEDTLLAVFQRNKDAAIAQVGLVDLKYCVGVFFPDDFVFACAAWRR